MTANVVRFIEYGFFKLIVYILKWYKRHILKHIYYNKPEIVVLQLLTLTIRNVRCQPKTMWNDTQFFKILLETYKQKEKV